LTGGGKLLFVAQDHKEGLRVAKETNALFSWLGTPPGFTLILFWRDDPRFLARTEWPSRSTVNGGYTYSGSNTIIVYRQEEWDRVLIHEAIHALRWDWDIPAVPQPCWGLGPQARLSPHLFEAWTELYAEWLWCGWHNVAWAKQLAWSRIQAVQILARAPATWKENTNVFAYYILKAALAPHIGFLWTLQNGMSDTERSHVLCSLVTPALAELRSEAARTPLKTLRMRMTVPLKNPDA
jgi:hypothetical protein